MDRAFQIDLQPIPGIIEVLDRMTLPHCVASSGPHRKMQTTLGVTGLLDRFKGRIYSAVDVGRGKPPFLTCSYSPLAVWGPNRAAAW
jgi:beta-phosphoglucomutase-like phosphatase (HAD superfamily)